jgi:hypothetical protein
MSLDHLEALFGRVASIFLAPLVNIIFLVGRNDFTGQGENKEDWHE